MNWLVHVRFKKPFTPCARKLPPLTMVGSRRYPQGLFRNRFMSIASYRAALASALARISIKGRLLLVGTMLTVAALIAASLSVEAVLNVYVQRSINQSLDGQIGLLARSVRPDGSVDRGMLVEIGPFTQYRRGWSWRIETSRVVVNSTEAIGKLDFLEEGPRGREGHFRAPPSLLRTGRSGDLYVRVLDRDTPGGRVRIAATAPRAVYERLRTAAVRPVLLILGGLSIVLLATSLLQLRIGLKPLARLKQSLEDVRGGRIARIPGDQPAELRAVVREANDLLDENEASLARARSHVANLAHSLKTPLATLKIKLSDAHEDPEGDLAELVEQIDRAIRHHLGRARASSPGAPGRLSVAVAPVVADLVNALMRIYMDRNIAFHVMVPEDMPVRCDPQDLGEMLGNLLDNAAKWASSHVQVTATERDRMLEIVVEDDGPGLGEAALKQVLLPGLRLDERGDGHGFGLPIARELAELHGGTLALQKSALGGLRAALLLPR
ncbi:MAG: HAMP domain-containing histidine kinase [Novosphingobium sp.]|nr:HAMP domain-containing histidine kinase [Novosphingobium sp.]